MTLSRNFVLIVQHADGSSATVFLAGLDEVAIGRLSAKCTPRPGHLCLPDRLVSRNHCRLYLKQPAITAPPAAAAAADDEATVMFGGTLPIGLEFQWWVQDLGSANGTSLNGQAVVHEMPLPLGGILTLGGTRMRLELGPELPVAAPPPPDPVPAGGPDESSPAPGADAATLSDDDITVIGVPRSAPVGFPSDGPTPATESPGASPTSMDGGDVPSPTRFPGSGTDPLLQLAELVKTGFLTQEEFTLRKRQLLGLDPAIPAEPAGDPSASGWPQPEGSSLARGLHDFVVEVGGFSLDKARQVEAQVRDLGLPVLRRHIPLEGGICLYLLDIGPFAKSAVAHQAAVQAGDRLKFAGIPGFSGFNVVPLVFFSKGQGRISRVRKIYPDWPGAD
ncbi:MAG: FHA domain-containing protein [Magnetococcales bacterium]|nr:FHA domain-containing protein [Magnetococcales bacterium]